LVVPSDRGWAGEHCGPDEDSVGPHEARSDATATAAKIVPVARRITWSSVGSTG
jgi:hypothetical protein